MLLQTNSYIVPKDKRAEHARLLRRFRQVLTRLGCDSFEVYEQVGSNWNTAEITGRVVQIMRFRDRRHQLAVQAAERNDPAAQAVIAEFCELINFPYQQQQGLFAVGFYNAVLPMGPRGQEAQDAQEAHDASDTQDLSEERPGSHAPEAPQPPHGADLAAAVAPAGVMAAGQAAVDEIAERPVEPSPAADAPSIPDEVALHDEVLSAVAPAHGPFADGGGEPIGAEAVDAEVVGAGNVAAAEDIAEEEGGAEGILDAAEHLSDEQLDAGGDAAVAEAIAGPTRVDAGPPGIDENGHGGHAVSASEGDQAREDELDLGSLLDAHLDRDHGDDSNQADGNHAASGNGKARGEWSDSLSLEDVLDDEPGGEHLLPGRAEGAMAPESEHDRNHVSQ